MTTTQPDPQEIYYSANGLRESIMQNREEYKSLLYEFYTLKPPFTRGRLKTKENVAEELKKYAEMIGHCLILGDSDILYQFGIKPIEQDITVLAGHDNPDIYINAFLKKFENSSSDGEKFYLAMLIRAFKAVKGESISAEILRID